MRYLRNSFLRVFVLITILLGIVGYYLNSIPARQMEHGQWVMHTHIVLYQLEILSGKVSEADLKYAVYKKTGAAGDYANYKSTLQNMQQSVTAIEQLTADNKRQQARITSLRQSIEQIDKQPDAVKQQIDIMEQDEKSMLEKRVLVWHGSMRQTRLYFIGGAAMIYLLMLLAHIIQRREIKSRERLIKIETETANMHENMASHMAQILDIYQEIMNQRMNLENIMQVITERTQAITKATGGVIEILEGEDMVYRAASGTAASYKGFRLKAKGSLTGLCVSEGTALRCDDSEEDPRVDKLACRKVGARSLIVVPLIQEGEIIGVLKVSSTQPNSFTAEDLGTLQLMSGVLSAALRNAVASDALQHSNIILQTEKQQLESEKQELTTRADTDGLTGIKNHRYFHECLEQEYIRAKRYNNALSLLLIDVDYFKKYNDKYGHLAGDAVLKKLANLLKDTTRPSDCVARYGGEEFAIILTQTPLEGALKTAERIRQRILDTKWDNGQITISVGVTGLENSAEGAIQLIKQADEALYQSKLSGRDKIMRFAA